LSAKPRYEDSQRTIHAPQPTFLRAPSSTPQKLFSFALLNTKTAIPRPTHIFAGSFVDTAKTSFLAHPSFPRFDTHSTIRYSLLVSFVQNGGKTTDFYNFFVFFCFFLNTLFSLFIQVYHLDKNPPIFDLFLYFLRSYFLHTIFTQFFGIIAVLFYPFFGAFFSICQRLKLFLTKDIRVYIGVVTKQVFVYLEFYFLFRSIIH
jgi:hypothetical protein